MREPGRRARPDRVLLAGYLLFVVAAGARSAVQLSTHAGRAPLAYSPSTLAAVIYVVGFALIAAAARWRCGRAALLWCVVELTGVLAVGSASVRVPHAFADATVWSQFGRGYGFVPLLLPVLAGWWLHHDARPTSDGPACAGQPGRACGAELGAGHTGLADSRTGSSRDSLSRDRSE